MPASHVCLSVIHYPDDPQTKVECIVSEKLTADEERCHQENGNNAVRLVDFQVVKSDAATVATLNALLSMARATYTGNGCMMSALNDIIQQAFRLGQEHPIEKQCA